MAEEHGVSRDTVREAFTALASERLVVRHPNRGVFVASLGAGDIHDVYTVRRRSRSALSGTEEAPNGLRRCGLRWKRAGVRPPRRTTNGSVPHWKPENWTARVNVQRPLVG
ncbi:GntR family transcriptional regulator [Pseudarthrobacter sp. N5]|uniref:GntR family transcriptional regulator n=1 Tax=Pseudarthrobacter sp. N5 TaxID=3418416 RepID=UPI003CF9A859